MLDDDLILEIKNLRVYFPLEEGMLKAVNGVSLEIRKNRTLGVVGESGCGKSVTAQSILRIVPPPGKVEGEILLHQNSHVVDLASLSPSGREMRRLRWREVAMIFQEPMAALSPVHTIGDQIMEVILLHEPVSKQAARQRTIELLARVGIASPDRRVDEYTYQLSGGMRQRAMIAMALALKPKLLIADEPTTALDVTIQAQILRLMKDLQAEMGMSIMFITHNLGVVANMADEVAVMYLGHVVEFGQVRQIFHTPQHPYTQALLQSTPKLGRKSSARLEAIGGSVPVPLNPPDECPFSRRCPRFISGRCDQGMPQFIQTERDHKVACVLYE
jgi:peptide/nickel transport system ATP-binding protein